MSDTKRKKRKPADKKRELDLAEIETSAPKHRKTKKTLEASSASDREPIEEVGHPSGKTKRSDSLDGSGSDRPKKKAAKRSFEKSEKAPARSDAYHITLNSGLFKDMQEFTKQITGDLDKTDPSYIKESVDIHKDINNLSKQIEEIAKKKQKKSNKKALEQNLEAKKEVRDNSIIPVSKKEDFNKALKAIYQLGDSILKDANVSATKGHPKEGGSVIIRQNQIDIHIRIDKTQTPTVNARIAIKGAPDKSTQDLANFALDDNNKTHESIFLAGLKGEIPVYPDNITSSKENKAYQDGTEARWVILLSDIMANPGSSVLSEKMISKVTSLKDYQTLFIGGIQNEFSFGAIPSQNQYTALDKNSNEYKTPFNALSELMHYGSITVTESATNQPVFRKLKVMSDFLEPNTMNFQFQKHKTDKIEELPDTKDLFDRVRKKATITRNEVSEDQHNRHALTLSDDEGSDEEGRKLSFFIGEEKNKRTRRISRTLTAAQSKERAHIRDEMDVDDDARDTALLALKIDVKKIKTQLSPDEQAQFKLYLEKIQQDSNQ